jgi:ubiquinone/menaquinone biosynthesis C-methylase UbiE
MGDEHGFNREQELEQSRHLWDAAAASFDDAPDHGLRDPIILNAWTNLLKRSLPSGGNEILDVGCGTGSLSLVLTGLGWEVTGIDFSPQMVALAEAKAAAAQQSVEFHVMDAAFPQFPPQQFDVVVCRHLLWMLPEPSQVLSRWADLLKPGGCLMLIEGFWHTGTGLHIQEVVDALPASFTHIAAQHLSDQTDLWGGEVTDERFMVLADLHLES